MSDKAAMNKSTTVVNVKVGDLRKTGCDTLVDWLNASTDHVYIGREARYVEGAKQSKWHNPFSAKQHGLDKCLCLYEEYIRSNLTLWDDIDDLDGKTLGCWCVPKTRCHGQVLIQLLNEKQGNSDPKICSNANV